MTRRNFLPMLGLPFIKTTLKHDNETPLVKFIYEKIYKICESYDYSSFMIEGVYPMMSDENYGIFFWWDAANIPLILGGKQVERFTHNKVLGSTIHIIDLTYSWKIEDLKKKFPKITKQEFLDAVECVHKKQVKRMDNLNARK